MYRKYSRGIQYLNKNITDKYTLSADLKVESFMMTCLDQGYKNFNVKEFLALSYAEGTPKETFLELMNTDFEKQDNTSGKLLELGTGPSVYTSLLASKYYSEITLSEYAECNRVELMKWLKQEEGAFDWSHFVNLISQLQQSDPKLIEERTRTAIKEIIPCDLTMNTPVPPYTGECFDCIISSATLECCFTDISSFETGLKKIHKLLVPGGNLFLLTVFGQTHYILSGMRYNTLNFNQKEFETVLLNAVFSEIIVTKIQNTAKIESDRKEIAYIKAVKQ